MTRIRILQLLHHVDSISSELTTEVARAFSDERSYDFRYGVLSGDAEEIGRLALPCATQAFGLSDREVGKPSRATLAALQRHMQEAAYDVVITHRYKPARLLSMLAERLDCKSHISIWHGVGEFDALHRRWLARRRMRRRWHHVGVSDAVSDDLRRRLQAGSRISSIHNGIDIERIKARAFSGGEARARLGLPDEALVLGTIGRTVPNKGHAHLVTAFADLLRRHSNARLLIIGGGRMEEALRRQSRELGIADEVLLTGALPQASRWLPAMDLFVMPSLKEALGLSLLEAMALGVPALGSAAGGIPEALGPRGRYFDPASSQAITDAVERYLAAGEAERAGYRRYLQERVREHFSAGRYHERLRRLVGEATRAGPG